MDCHTAPGYKHTKSISRQLTVTIPRAAASQTGTYRCQVDGYRPEQFSACDFSIQSASVLNCTWSQSNLTCHTARDYQFDRKVTNTATVKIPKVSASHTGTYSCQLAGATRGDFEDCVFNLDEGQATYCNIPSVKPMETATLTCNFNVDINKTKTNFNIVHFSGQNNTGVDVLNCVWQHDDLICDITSGFEFSRPVTDRLAVTIPRANHSHIGEYLCHLQQYLDKATRCKFILDSGANSTVSVIVGVLITIILLVLMVVGILLYRRFSVTKRNNKATLTNGEDQPMLPIHATDETTQRLQESLSVSMKTMYPENLTASYFVPSLYLNRNTYTNDKMAREKVVVMKPAQDDTLRHDHAIQHVLNCLRHLADRDQQAMFVLSQFTCDDYLASVDEQFAHHKLPMPSDLTRRDTDYENFDVLIVHRQYGVVVVVVKASVCTADMGVEIRDNERVVQDLREAVKQLDGAERMLKHLMADVRPDTLIRKTLMLPNLSLTSLEEILAKHQDVAKALRHCTGLTDLSDISRECLCADQLHGDNMVDQLQKWLRVRPTSSADPSHSENDYKMILSRMDKARAPKDLKVCPQSIEMETENTKNDILIFEEVDLEKKEMKMIIKKINYLSASGGLFILVDDAGPYREDQPLFTSFCEQLVAVNPKLHLWAASCLTHQTPNGWDEKHFHRTVSCPPAILREENVLMLAQKPGCKNLVKWDPDNIGVTPTEGLPVKYVYHHGHGVQGHSRGYPFACEKCCHDVITLLKALGLETDARDIGDNCQTASTSTARLNYYGRDDAILDCWWLGGHMDCYSAPGYKHTKSISRQLTVTIPRAAANQTGTYACQSINQNSCLLAVFTTDETTKRLQESLSASIQTMYPDILTASYFVPSLYINRNMYRKVEVAGEKVVVMEAAPEDTLSTTTSSSTSSTVCATWRTETSRPCLSSHSSPYGVVVVVVKASVCTADMGVELRDNERVVQDLREAVKQLDGAERMLKHLMPDVRPDTLIRKTLMLPNISLRSLREVLEKQKDVANALRKSTGLTESLDISGECLCADQLHSVNMVDELKVWIQKHPSGSEVDANISDDNYRKIVSRLCGPATRPSLTLPDGRRVCAPSSQEHAVSLTGELFNGAIIHPQHQQLLTEAPPRVFMFGPQGSGKTTSLRLMGKKWLSEGHRVCVLSTWWDKEASSRLLHGMLLKDEAQIRCNFKQSKDRVCTDQVNRESSTQETSSTIKSTKENKAELKKDAKSKKDIVRYKEVNLERTDMKKVINDFTIDVAPTEGLPVRFVYHTGEDGTSPDSLTPRLCPSDVLVLHEHNNCEQTNFFKTLKHSGFNIKVVEEKNIHLLSEDNGHDVWVADGRQFRGFKKTVVVYVEGNVGQSNVPLDVVKEGRKLLIKKSEKNKVHKQTTSTSEEHQPMLSIQATDQTTQRLQDSLSASIKTMYPDILTACYFVPSLYINRNTYTKAEVAGEKVVVMEPAPDDTLRHDHAIQHVLKCLRHLADTDQQAMFVLSQFTCDDYLASVDEQFAHHKLPMPSDLTRRDKDYENFDVLIVHRQYGVVVVVVKASVCTADMGVEIRDNERVVQDLREAVKQLDGAERMLKHLMADVRSGIAIRKTLMLPNLSLKSFTEILEKHQDVAKSLRHCTGLTQLFDISGECLCADQLHSDNMVVQLQVWLHHHTTGSSADPSLSENNYQTILSRLCGAATRPYLTLPDGRRVCTPSSLQQAVSLTGELFNGAFIHPEHQQLRKSRAPLDLHVHPQEVNFVNVRRSGREDQLFIKSFCEQLLAVNQDLHLWAASCFTHQIPNGWDVKHFQRTVSCPPAILRENNVLMLAQKNGCKDVIMWDPYNIGVAPTEGLPVKYVYHHGQNVQVTAMVIHLHVKSAVRKSSSY
ncbi:hypothetical protein C0Q70_17609 [Pomacea canaliculata]|uniref:Ig-like domain-containing protein n=1 Tax=Pomacea canaliculata TaxID=400727 RepID=A0A2T7NKV5_POMCA|nr:hypothetical protein C0Q70_17609 [Pomacea canaliculata]